MKNKKTKHQQQQSQKNHDDCEDCKRERRQNQALIAMYERLQVIDSRTKNMRKSIDFHQKQCYNTHNKFSILNEKFKSLPKEGKTNYEIKNYGNQMAKQMIEQATKGYLKKQNERLKKKLAQMHKIQPAALTHSMDFEPQHEPQITNQQLNKFNKSSRMNTSRYRLTNLAKQTSIFSQKIDEEESEIEDAITTGFFSNKNNRSILSRNANRLDDLNLWLYDTERHKGLQQELNETTNFIKPINRSSPQRSYMSTMRRSKGVALPSIQGSRR